jgi:D-glycero-D-manno-heptose 1,7-bisphosphate phosphatase
LLRGRALYARVSLLTGWRSMRACTKDAPVSRMSRSSPSSIELSAPAQQARNFRRVGNQRRGLVVSLRPGTEVPSLPGVRAARPEAAATRKGRAMDGSALFLDRDGVINVDRGYVYRLHQFEFVPGIFQLARFWANELRRPIVVVTNQSGIGRGYFDESAYADLTRWMCDRFEAEGAAIARVYHCPYHPLHGIGEYRRDHPWRKPKPGMILQAVSDLGLDPARCVIVGDQMSDIEAGTAAGLGLRILLAARPGERKEGAPSHEVVPISAKRSPCCGRALRRPQPFAGPGLLEASPIRRLHLPLRSAITMAASARLNTLGQRGGREGWDRKPKSDEHQRGKRS